MCTLVSYADVHLACHALEKMRCVTSLNPGPGSWKVTCEHAFFFFVVVVFSRVSAKFGDRKMKTADSVNSGFESLIHNCIYLPLYCVEDYFALDLGVKAQQWRRGTSLHYRKARGEDWTRLPVSNLALCHWSSRFFICAPSSLPSRLPSVFYKFQLCVLGKRSFA